VRAEIARKDNFIDALLHMSAAWPFFHGRPIWSREDLSRRACVNPMAGAGVLIVSGVRSVEEADLAFDEIRQVSSREEKPCPRH